MGAPWHEPDVKRRALALIQAGYTTSQAANELGLSTHTVSTWKTRSACGNVYIGKGQNIHPEKWRELEQLCFHTRPVTPLREVARRLGISRTTARYMWVSIREYRLRGEQHPKMQRRVTQNAA